MSEKYPLFAIRLGMPAVIIALLFLSFSAHAACTLKSSAKGDTMLCAGSVSYFKATPHSGSTYAWTVSGGTILSGSGTDSITISWSKAITGSVKMVETNGSCMDSIFQTINVNALPAAKAGGNQSICNNKSMIKLGMPGLAGMSYSWSSKPAGFTSTLSDPYALCTGAMSYYITILDSNTNCTAMDSAKITMGSGMPANYGTYFGGSADEYISGMILDKAENIILAGITHSSGLATSGAFKTSVNSLGDAFLAKFNCSGFLEWATYFGGSSGVSGYSFATDTFGNIFLAGMTSSVSGIATKGSFKTSISGPQDAYLAKFSSNGSLIWSTYFGGNDREKCYGITTDRTGNVYIVGETYSTSGLATSGAYKTSISGSNDAFIAKFSTNGTQLWATYYGGTGGNYALRIESDSNSNTIVLGITGSSTGIATAGTFQTSYAGMSDNFIVKFDSTGNRVWGTYFGGSNIDGLGTLHLDIANDIYISGWTRSAGLATSNAYQTSMSSKEYGFLAKLDSTGNRIWSTYYGGNNTSSLGNITSDSQNNVYIAGLTTSASGIATKGAYQGSYSGGHYDGLVAEFSKTGKRIWSSYFGGSDDDYCGGLALDIAGNIYISGETTSSNNIATSGAFQTTHNVGLDAFFFKFSKFCTPIKSIIIGEDTACQGTTVSYQASPHPGSTYSWSVTGGAITYNNNDSITVNWTKGGLCTLKLMETSPRGCSDSTKLTVYSDSACVWPGDANNDKIVNMLDFLHIGVGFGTFGKPRPGASLLWSGQSSPNWKDTFSGGINYKFADCNGDSLIFFNDSFPILANYSLTHLKNYTFNQGSPTDPHLSLILSRDSAQAGDVVKADIFLGDGSIPATNMYGMAFSIIYPAALVDTVLADLSGSWISANKISLSKKAADGKLDLAVVRTDQKDTSGFGKLGSLYFKIGSSLPASYVPIVLKIAENTQINATVQYRPVYLQSDSLMVRQTFTAIKKESYHNQDNIVISPNPTNTELNIVFPENKTYSIRITDLLGKEIMPLQIANSNEFKILTSHIPAGVYTMTISVNNTLARKKLVIQH